MIKITIIFILIFLLVITIYSYYCLSSRMIDFQRQRLEYILQKEAELKIQESKIKVVSDCSNKNELLTNTLTSINNIIGEANVNGNLNICQNSKYNIQNSKNDKIVKEIENVISEKDNNNGLGIDENKDSYIHDETNYSINQETILNDVPLEYIQQ